MPKLTTLDEDPTAVAGLSVGGSPARQMRTSSMDSNMSTAAGGGSGDGDSGGGGGGGGGGAGASSTAAKRDMLKKLANESAVMEAVDGK
eukprot:SAG22_NODE_8454_length_655_cov_0.705036_1_plen_89_part_00